MATTADTQTPGRRGDRAEPDEVVILPDGSLADDRVVEFWSSGVVHLRRVLDVIDRRVQGGFSPRSALDFGCGVGRLLVPLAVRAPDVYGVEASDNLRALAAGNLAERQLSRVRLAASLAELRTLRGTLDFVHSTLAFPHIRRRPGERSLADLVAMLGPGGCGTVHVLVGRRAPGWRRAAGAARARGLVVGRSLGLRRRQPVPGTVAPELNAYDLDRLLVILAGVGISEVWIESVVQGHAVDVNLYFQRRA